MPPALRHAEDDELIYPGTCRPKGDKWQVTSDMKSGPPVVSRVTRHVSLSTGVFAFPTAKPFHSPTEISDQQQFVAGKDFGDFVVWRHDDVPAYQLACVVDDAAMQITEVVRGADLLVSTARQILLYRALGLKPPEFFHCPLMQDESGQRLAKRHDALSLRTLRGPAGKRRKLAAQLAGGLTGDGGHPLPANFTKKLLVNYFTIRQSFAALGRRQLDC